VHVIASRPTTVVWKVWFHMRGLFHAINALHQAHDPILLTGFLETGKSFHEHGLSLREDAMKEGRFNVDVLDVPVKDSSNVYERSEGVKACRRRSSLVVVNGIALNEAFYNVTDFVASDVACIIMHAFADEPHF
jgi:hypothetical protein